MSELVEIHQTILLDHTVERKNESHHHWAVKAAIVNRLRSNPAIVGEVTTESKTGERIGDIRCCLSEAPQDVPQRFTVEIETPASSKDRYQATIDHLRHGYAVYWVFTVNAVDERRTTEKLLGEQMSSRPSLGVAALPDGELSLGAPIMWGEIAYEAPWLGQTEFRIPTYNRQKDWYCHGDFRVDGQRISILRQPGREELFISQYVADGQQTLPQPSDFSKEELHNRIQDGDVKRISPVRGPP